MTNRVFLYDTTLRDGAQTSGVDFSLRDKQLIAAELAAFGLDYLECGWPGANPLDDAFFEGLPAEKTAQAKIVAFGMTRRLDTAAEDDAQVQALLRSRADAVCLVGKTWDFHVDVALHISLAENIKLIESTVKAAADAGKEVLFDAEHFFDGYAANPAYALECVEAAYKSGARWVVLCDTNGGTLPHQVFDIVTKIQERIPGANLGIHCHNDTENAVANSLAAVRAGARQIQGTFNGLGERCGNANLASIIPTLMLKMGFETGIAPAQLQQISLLSRRIDDRINRPHNRHAAYVGESAFTHKGGLHISAVLKNPLSYEHIDPALVGNARKILVSDQAGKSALVERLQGLNVALPTEPARLNDLLARIKELEFEGYAFENADASFVLLAEQVLRALPPFFTLKHFRVIDEKTVTPAGGIETASSAAVRVSVDGTDYTAETTGNGPVNALDAALRDVLLPLFPALKDVSLIDYKVRILTPHDGTKAVTRVLIETRDADGRLWTTVGVSSNVIDASCKAVEDALRYKLLRSQKAG
ncbi:MAG: citramalate synthase [Alphaproteobacteria bacterium]|jgi:2-isopropylmalate synthase|nr:citramalate synthase [Thalassospira sp.]MCE2965620.1 citramalate synthase [Alphaproteobacteria bacterium]